MNKSAPQSKQYDLRDNDAKIIPFIRVLAQAAERRLAPGVAVKSQARGGNGHATNFDGAAAKPRTYCALDRLPAALIPLTRRRRWVLWRWEPGKKDGKWTKVPYRPTDPQRHAKSNDTSTWSDYATALAAYSYKGNNVDGIGVMLLKGDVVALDLDKCRDAESEQLTPWGMDYVAKAAALGAYIEVTVSGTGLRIIGRGDGSKVHRKFSNIGEDASSIEVYRRCERYITVSGLQVGECTALPNIDALIDAVIEKYAKESSDSDATAAASDNKLSPEQYHELMEHGTIDGNAIEHRGPAFQAVVWHLAAKGHGLDEIIALLRQHPNGVAAKYLQPTDRLAEETKRSFDKYLDVMPDVIARWNRNHAHVLAGSKSAILQEFTTSEGFVDFKLLSSASFHEWYAEHKIVVGQDKDGEDIIGQISRYWLKHPRRRKYQDLGFFPNKDVPGFYNLWRGFTVKPREGDCSKFLAHLHDNICQGNEELFAWVEAWFASMFQDPEKKYGTSLAMRGRQGVGKTVVGEVIGSLLGPHYKLVSDPRYVTGRFNSHMTSLLLLFADEGFWAGDKKAEGKLKDLVTGKSHPIEFKGKEPFWINNYVRLLVSGNEDWIVPAGFEERRFATLDAGDEHREDHAYFAAIDREMHDGGREALLHHLLYAVDCSKVNLRQIPHTSALIEQKVQSANPEQAWWLDILSKGMLPGDWDGTGTSPSEMLFADYIEHARKKGVPRRSIETQLGMFLAKMVADGLRRNKETFQGAYKFGPGGRSHESKRGLVYHFPPLKECRDRFAKLLEEEIEWDEDDQWTPAECDDDEIELLDGAQKGQGASRYR